MDSAGCPDAGFALRLGAYTGSINNMGHYSNAEVDELIDKMMSTTDKTVREECAKRIQEIVVWEDPYCLYIAEPGFDLVVTKDIENHSGIRFSRFIGIQCIEMKINKNAT